MDPVRGFGYAPPLWAARSANKRRTCSSGGTEPGVVSCRRIASLTALVAAAADSSPSVWSRRGWFEDQPTVDASRGGRWFGVQVAITLFR
jgi:hypothetical protein